MNDLKFACPNCGHEISCDSRDRGVQITCPDCQQPLTVPPMREPPPKSDQPETTGRPCGLATASLVCSLFLSLGCIPGIICGHLALSRLRHNIFLKGKGMATAGLIVSYLALFSTIGFVVVGALVLAPRHVRQLTAQEEAANTPAVMAARRVDEVLIADPASEQAHGLQCQGSGTGNFYGKNWRDAADGGWFSYSLKVDPVRPMSLYCTYWGNDSDPGRLFDILVNDQVIATQKLDFNDPGHFFDVEYEIPKSLTAGQSEITVEFQAHPGMSAGGVFGLQMLKR
jgi:Family of unknown function (DUF6805)/Domain of unknown function (DUF4190)